MFQSFFGRSYNNQTSVTECKNNNDCVINKKNRTACKSCRLRKCLHVGMSKSGSRYGRRSNWFKIHCLLQEQNLNTEQNQNITNPSPTMKIPVKSPLDVSHNFGMNLLTQQHYSTPPTHFGKTKEELIMLGYEDYKHAASPSVSSPESHNSDSSVEISDARRMVPILPTLFNNGLFSNPNLLFPSTFYSSFMPNTDGSSNNPMFNHNNIFEVNYKRAYFDAFQRLLNQQEQRDPIVDFKNPCQESPIDLSVKSTSDRGSTPTLSERSGVGIGSDADEESDCDSKSRIENLRNLKNSPIDLTTRL